METYFLVIVKASVCLSLFYVVSLPLFRNSKAFKFQRFYLLFSILISVTLPFNKYSINILKEKEFIATLQPSNEILTEPISALEPVVAKTVHQKVSIEHVRNVFSYTTVFAVTYWAVVFGLFFRVLYSLIYIVVYYIHSEHLKQGKYSIIFHPSIRTSFSFLRWIFIHEDIKHSFESQSVIKHEIIHAKQYHSLDIIAIELLSAVMWFNPIIWMMRKELQQLHEYLADEGVIRSGTDVLEYQTLLVNQVAGGRLICLPSGFNQSLIKKRLEMMTKPQINQKNGYRLFMLLPLTGFMFLILSFTNQKVVTVKKDVMKNPLTVYHPLHLAAKIFVGNNQKQEPKTQVFRDTVKHNGSDLTLPPPPPQLEVVAAVSPTRMNVFYLGVDNPVDIAVAGIPAKDVIATVDNGAIRIIRNSYIVNPQIVGKATISVFEETNGSRKLLRTVEFRVKRIPDPVLYIAGKKGGQIAINKLLEANEVKSILENFDFDAGFFITEFTVTASVSGVTREIPSKSNKITDEQKEMIKKLVPGDKVYFTDIKTKGPDGLIRDLSTVVFTIEK